MILLSRDNFRDAVFKRDQFKCVVPNCLKSHATGDKLDAHHLIDRMLWENGGYFLNNGVSLCGEHHLEAEMTLLSVAKLREYAHIQTKVLPDHLTDDCEYTKWGDIEFANGSRSPGQMFDMENVQKILKQANVLDLYTHLIKYPRTYHFTWSEGLINDDRMQTNLDAFVGQRVIVTEKLDGENSSLYEDYYHARSIDSPSHASRNWLKQFHNTFKHDIPEKWRICGENVYAKHSIHYENLKSYFYGFSIWDDKNFTLSWDDTIEWFNLFGIEAVPVLYDGIWDEKTIKNIALDASTQEGYVCRVARRFHYSEFRNVVGKVVRKGHVQTDQHWKETWIPNKLVDLT